MIVIMLTVLCTIAFFTLVSGGAYLFGYWESMREYKRSVKETDVGCGHGPSHPS